MSLHEGVSQTELTIETPETWVVRAFADSLDVALQDSVRIAIGWVAADGGIDRRGA
ncbi:MAG TPA: hypothetical protein VEF89_19310 [Solirubrobacteraceae bacterium]|nr:hypothetical protein [Solirubrobacteraceae bacterium]